MLRTNSNKYKENIKNYIIENFDYSNYEDDNHVAPTEYKDICKCIYNTMEVEKFHAKEATSYLTFKSWCQGLPSILDTCYYYNRSAIEDVKNLLEQAEEESSKYTESQAEEYLTRLIYNEIIRHLN